MMIYAAKHIAAYISISSIRFPQDTKGKKMEKEACYLGC